ncbi:hypothetical protein ACJW8F_13170 [Plesiomonas shigelloides]|uniref:hypothetical protein n=1 Tax=Plesiomonas shigelloides TaxID=703 RepID=UPI00387F28F6
MNEQERMLAGTILGLAGRALPMTVFLTKNATVHRDAETPDELLEIEKLEQFWIGNAAQFDVIDYDSVQIQSAKVVDGKMIQVAITISIPPEDCAELKDKVDLIF